MMKQYQEKSSSERIYSDQELQKTTFNWFQEFLFEQVRSLCSMHYYIDYQVW
jgi:hypothetical protein